MKTAILMLMTLLISLSATSAVDLTWETCSNADLLLQYLTSPTIVDDMYFDSTYDVMWDKSVYTFHFADNAELGFGNTASSPDVTIDFDATNFEILTSTSDLPFHIGSAADGFDVKYYFEDAGTLDLDYDGDILFLSDSMKLGFGNTSAAPDVYMRWDATNFDVLATVDDSQITFGTATLAFDIVWNCGTSGDYVQLDASEGQCLWEDVQLQMQDDTTLSFGDADDVTLQYDENGNDELQVTGAIGFDNTVTFRGGQTRKVLFSPADATIDGTAGPAAAVIGTSAQAQQDTLQFDADGGSTGDDHAYVVWHVPDGYVVDSARLNVAYTFSTAEDAADEAQFDFTVNAVAAGEALDAAGTALADQTTVIADASADNGKLHVTQYNIEVEDIAVDDIVTIKVTVDESASALANSGTLDVLYFEIEYESTE